MVETTRQTLETERRQAEQDLEAKEASLADFSAEHPKLAPRAALSNDRDRDRPTDTAAEVASLELRSVELQAMLAPAQPTVAGAAHAADPAVVAARAKVAADLSAVERDLDDKQTRLPYQHPDVKVALKKVAEARAALRKADAAVAASVAAPARALSGEKLASLQRALAAVRSRIAVLEAQRDPTRATAKTTEAAGAADAAGTRLAQAVSDARERRRKLETELFQAQLLSTLGAAGQGGGLVVSERSFQPSRPIPRHRFRVVLVGASLSALLALLAVMVTGRLDRHLHDPADITRILGPKVVVVVPKLGIKLVGRTPARITNTGA